MIAVLFLTSIVVQAESTGELDKLEQFFAAKDWGAYEAELNNLRADEGQSEFKRAVATVRLASYRHSIRQQGFAESAEQLPPALAVLETTTPDSPWLAEGKAQYATALYRLQRLAEAREPAEQGAALARKLLAHDAIKSEERVRLYTAFNVLASIYMLSGEEDRARPLFEETIAALEREAPGHQQLGAAYVNYGLILYNFGRYRELADIMAKAGRIFETSGNAVARAATKVNHGLALNQLGDYTAAEPLLAAGAAGFEAIGASRAPIFANAVQNWGIAAGYLGDTDAALERINRALELRTTLYGENNHEVAVTLAHRARVYLQRGAIAKALKDSTRAAALSEGLPAAHLDLELTILDVHLHALAAGGRTDDLPAAHDRYRTRLAAYTRHQLAYGHEGERLAFLRRHDPVSAAITTGDAVRIGEALFRYQGLVSDAVAEDRQAALADPAMLKEWRDALREPATDADTLRRLETLLALNAAMVGVTRFALDTNLAELRTGLPSGRTLLLFHRYQPWRDGINAPARYGILVLPGWSGEPAPVWRDLGEAKTIDTQIARYLLAIESGEHGDIVHAFPRWLESKLHDLLPAATRELFYVAEGAWQRVPFGGLTRSDDRFWAEHFSVFQLASARDLRPQHTRNANPPRLLIAGAPASLNGWADLPGARQECDTLSAAARQAGWASETFVGNAATEPNVIAASRSATHLHLATHGYAVTPPERAEPFQWLADQGLVWAKASPPTHKSLPPDPDDGLLSALEIVPLDLTRVQLVTLAACSSAAGTPAARETRYGLPLAFRRAGVRDVVSSLWPVEDAAAAAWMEAFYQRILAGEPAAPAFAATQRERLRAAADQSGLASALREQAAWVLLHRPGNGD
ncbi:MAG: CHAT domain-containing tetratricopeptide repeat protein [Opitutaceae bacterium]